MIDRQGLSAGEMVTLAYDKHHLVEPSFYDFHFYPDDKVMQASYTVFGEPVS